MKQQTFIRLLLLVLLVFGSLFFFSYARFAKTERQCCSDNEKCDQQPAHPESIIWEAFTHNVLSAR